MPERLQKDPVRCQSRIEAEQTSVETTVAERLSFYLCLPIVGVSCFALTHESKT